MEKGDVLKFHDKWGVVGSIVWETAIIRCQEIDYDETFHGYMIHYYLWINLPEYYSKNNWKHFKYSIIEKIHTIYKFILFPYLEPADTLFRILWALMFILASVMIILFINLILVAI
jgi:hypothetical protein